MDQREEKARRLREARAKAGYEDASKAARAFGWGDAGYRHHENGTRGFGADAAKKYARAFKVKAAWLLAIETADEKPLEAGPKTSNDLLVSDFVQAGMWREATGMVDDAYTIVDMPSPVQGAKRFGVTVRGHSMDLFYEPGTVLDCVSIFGSPTQPQSGDHVIVERVRPDGLRELTVKEFLVEDGRFFLVPRSTKPEWSDRIEIGNPDHDYVGDDVVQVIAFVVASYPPRVLRLFERMEKIRR